VEQRGSRGSTPQTATPLIAKAREVVAASHLSRRFVFNFYLGQRPAPAAETP
jgi:hypothetical protein